MQTILYRFWMGSVMKCANFDDVSYRTIEILDENDPGQRHFDSLKYFGNAMDGWMVGWEIYAMFL